MVLKVCAKQLAQAAREEYFDDAQGRSVRKKHAVRTPIVVDGDVQMLMLWADIEKATPRHMHMALQQRRRASLMDNKQLENDMDSWNENNRPPNAPKIQLSFNYEPDLAEMKESPDYRDERPESDDDED